MSGEGVPQVGDSYILGSDPLFVDASHPDGPDDTWATEDDGLRLQQESPAITQGTNSFLSLDTEDIDGDEDTTEPLPIDLAGFKRIQGGQLDLGAYEATHYYNLDVSISGEGSTIPSSVNPYAEDSSVSVNASTVNGYVFEKWTGDEVSPESSIQVFMDGDHNVTANFGNDLSDEDNDGLTAF